VTVCLSGRKYIGVVWSESEKPDIEESKIQNIESIADYLPKISAEEIKLWTFLASYYLCTPGEVFKAAYPTSRIESEETLARIKERKLAKDERMRAVLLARAERQVAKLTKKGLDIPQDLLDIIKNEGRTSGESSDNRRTEIVKDAKTPGKPTLLLASNRLETYRQKTRECLNSGRSVLILIPEIAISERLQQDFEAEFGSAARIYNSSQTAKQRRDTAELLRDTSSPEVIIGTRCAIFLPYKELGLIIVDEEQDPSYKQTEPDPRMNARDAAVVLGKIHGAELLLGSSAPSLESLFNCKIGKYELQGGIEPIELPIIDVSLERKKNGMIGHFSRKLIQTVQESGSEIAFIRGWEKTDELGSEIQELFPGKHVSVFTAKEALRLPDTDIRKLDLVAILQADALFPKGDFRADERAFQLIRRLITTFPEKQIIIQTSKSEHPVFKALAADFDSKAVLEERRRFNMPPYSKVVDAIVKDGATKRLNYLSQLLADAISERLAQITKPSGASILETQFSVSPLSTSEEGEVTLRWFFPRQEAEAKKRALLETILKFEKDKKYTGHIHIDVDPI